MLGRKAGVFAGLVLACAATFWATPANADDAAVKAQKGMQYVRLKDCSRAIPLFEEAELSRHQPRIALALADCYEKEGRLINAVELLRALADEKPTRRHGYADRLALKKAKKRLEQAEARIPTVAFELAGEYPNLEVFLNGEKIDNPSKPRQVEPNSTFELIARAKGFEELRDDFTIGEGEQLIRPLRLEPLPKPTNAVRKRRERTTETGPWIGARGRMFVIPNFAWKWFGDGGRTVVAPGGAVTHTTETSGADVMVTLGYTNFKFGPTPFKPKGAPDNDYELIESDMQALSASVELIWRTPIDDAGRWQFNYGGGAGLGWTFLGDLKRTQAYPPGLEPGDPYGYEKCNGPNDPAGTFYYCNELDHDAEHYNYNEPSWFSGGHRPTIYPWVALPQIGITYKAAKDVALDMEAGVTLSGFLFGIGLRLQ